MDTNSTSRNDHFADSATMSGGGMALGQPYPHFRGTGRAAPGTGRTKPDNPHSDSTVAYAESMQRLDAASNARKAAKRQGKDDARAAAGKDPKVRGRKYQKPMNTPEITA